MITMQWAYMRSLGLMFAAFALLSALDRTNRKRFGNAAFWGLMALSLLAGSWLGDFANGLLVLGLAGLAGFGLLGRSAPPTTSEAERARLVRAARQPAVPARLDHPGDRADRHPRLQLHAARPAGLDRGRSARPTSSSASAR